MPRWEALGKWPVIVTSDKEWASVNLKKGQRDKNC